jgi:hypothetical protein
MNRRATLMAFMGVGFGVDGPTTIASTPGAFYDSRVTM